MTPSGGIEIPFPHRSLLTRERPRSPFPFASSTMMGLQLPTKKRKRTMPRESGLIPPPMPSEEKSSGLTIRRCGSSPESRVDTTGWKKNLKASPRPTAPAGYRTLRQRIDRRYPRSQTGRSSRPRHYAGGIQCAETSRDVARQVLGALAPESGNSVRLGITGVPGAGTKAPLSRRSDSGCVNRGGMWPCWL